MDRGIGSWITKRAFLSGQRVAFVAPGGGDSPDREFTYLDAERRTNRLASALHDLGVRHGDRVAGVLANSVEFMEVLFACAKLGAIFVPVNVRLTAGEIGYLLADSSADVLVHHGALSEVSHAALREPGVRVRTTVCVSGREGDAEIDYESLLAAGSPEPLDRDVAGTDLVCLMYTSGTTGRPKGAMLTHDNMLWNAINIIGFGRGLRETDTTVTVAPMFHIGGLGVHSLPLVYVGGTNVVPASFDPTETLAAMARHRVTVQFMVPAMWAAVSRVPDLSSYDLSALELAVAGGSPAPLTVIEYFREHGVPFQEGFGMTETAPMVSMLDADNVVAKAGSIGRTAFHVEGRIVDEDDRTVGAGTVGELVVRGPNVFVGYWNQPEATAEAFRGGWFHTGDLGRMDEQGFVTLVDRKKDMIISGGENVYPVEVEQVLYQHPAVVEAAVVGIADERWGEVPLAVVAAEPDAELDAESLTGWLRERLAGFKTPKRVEFVDALPRNATGKVLKTDLRGRFASSTPAGTAR